MKGKPRQPAGGRPRPRSPRSSRQLAAAVLMAQEASGRPLDQVLAEQLAQQELPDPRDRQLVMALVYEVLRRRGILDQVVARYARHPLAGMKPLTLACLRLGICQLLFFDRLPAAAVINETVGVLRAARQPAWLTGFVNAVLRKVAAEKEKIPGLSGDDAELVSHPAWLVARWQARYGAAITTAICRANNQPAPLCLRVERSPQDMSGLVEKEGRDAMLAALAQAGIVAIPGLYAPAAVRISDYHGRIEELPGYGEGLFQIQDEAAQLVSMLFGPLAPGRYLDACAGLGGKTTHLARLLPAVGALLALEPHPGRLELLRRNLARLGGQAEIHQTTLAEFAARPAAGQFQGILLDVPCSGLGVIRRHPDIRWNRQPADLLRYQEQQVALLEQAASLLAPGGVLVYAVCSMEPEETEAVITRLRTARPELKLSDPRPWLPPAAVALVDDQGFFRSRPDQQLDGFFAARLKRV